jgi:flavin-binding protein dodecin
MTESMAELRSRHMSKDNIYRKTELVGTSSLSIDDAIQSAIARASKTLRHVEWFEVGEIRGHVADGKVAHFQVVLKVGFRLED